MMARSTSNKERSSNSFSFKEEIFGKELSAPLIPRRVSTVESGILASGSGSASASGSKWSPERRRKRLNIIGATVCCLVLGYYGVKYALPDGQWRGVGSSKVNSAWDAAVPQVNEEGEIRLDPVNIVDDLMGTVVLPDDPTHILVPQAVLQPQPLLRPLYHRPDASILTSYYVDGVLPDHPPKTESPPVDIVYLWVNSSGPVFNQAMLSRAESEGIEIEIGEGNRYRDNGELRGAVRSAKSALHGLGTIHVLSGDFPIPDNTDHLPKNIGGETLEEGGWRLGQIPTWLNWETVRDGTAGLKWHFHSKVYRTPVDDYDSLEDKAMDWEYESEWREMSVPSFNSFAIESRVGWIDGLAENFILANDDMFMVAELSSSDFSHPLLGDVIRADAGLLVKPEIGDDLLSTGGEWGGLQHASQMISRRFPSLARGYMYHVPKSLSVSLMHEASVIWEDELTEAATRGFRRSMRGMGDVEISWLVGFLRVERWREALLWSWAVARMGGESGLWGQEAREEVKRVLRMTTTKVNAVMVHRQPRKTLADLEAINQKMEWETARRTAYFFSSMDGIMHQRPGDEDFCMFEFDECLPAHFFSDPSHPIDAEYMFTHLAFAQPQCGDCMIKALISASGDRGLSAVLPHAEQTILPEERRHRRWERTEPILPLTDHWQYANFSAHSIIRPLQDQWRGTHQEPNGRVSLRQWCIKLLSRYAYVLGGTEWEFELIQNLEDLEKAIAKVDTPQGEPAALVCFNDDQPDDAPDGVRERFGGWMEGKWSHVDAKWEKEGIPWV